MSGNTNATLSVNCGTDCKRDLKTNSMSVMKLTFMARAYKNIYISEYPENYVCVGYLAVECGLLLLLPRNAFKHFMSILLIEVKARSVRNQGCPTGHSNWPKEAAIIAHWPK